MSNNRLMAVADETSEIDILLVKSLWENEECPYFDLVMHANGRICILSPASVVDGACCGAQLPLWIPASQVVGIDCSKNRNEGFSAHYRIDLFESNLTVSCGECCSSGENGHISVTRTSSGDLVWLVFLVSSNPFKAIEIDKNKIIAHSTDGRKFQLALDNPNSIRILD